MYATGGLIRWIRLFLVCVRSGASLSEISGIRQVEATKVRAYSMILYISSRIHIMLMYR